MLTINGVIPGPIRGTRLNDAALAGHVGEEISSTITSGSAVSLATATPKTITSITLTPGDWDVTGQIIFLFPASTSVTWLATHLSQVDNTADYNPGKSKTLIIPAVVPGNGSAEVIWAGPDRFSVAVDTVVSLVAMQIFTVSTLTAYGKIRARRMR